MTYYDRVFLAPLARSHRSDDRCNLDTIIEREFSDELRDPRFLPGWYILPGLAIAGVIIAVFA
jgi:hypothetical protein